MNKICTWLCVDEIGEESIFPQTGVKSSSPKHQNIYWRCIVVFFITSKRFNTNCEHILYSNTNVIPNIDGVEVEELLEKLGVKIIYVPFKHKTPKGYWGTFQNQFYEFSILEMISTNIGNDSDLYLILDSDCIFLKSAEDLFKLANDDGGYASITETCNSDYVINGLNLKDMKLIYEDLLNYEIKDVPRYHLGEFLLLSKANIKKISTDFYELWPKLLTKHEKGELKFNEEAHSLSYLYYKNGFTEDNASNYVKRIWTNPVFYRNVTLEDTGLTIWHLPSEKRFGFEYCYDFLVNKCVDFGFNLSDELYLESIYDFFSVPHLTIKRTLIFYLLSYYRASVKRIKKFIA